MIYIGLGMAVAAISVFCGQGQLIAKGRFVGASIVFVLMSIIFSLLFYLDPPALTGPFWGLTGYLVLGITVSYFFGCSQLSQDARRGSPNINVWGSLTVFGFVSLAIFRSILGSGLVEPGKFATMIGKVEAVESASDFSPVQISHIRMVTLEQASWAGDKAMGKDGTIGSQFKPGKYSLQRVDDKLYWVSPLEFLSFARWQATEGTPGYLMVDAEDASAEAKLVTMTGKDKNVFRFTPGAFFGRKLTRHIWESGYKTYEVWDTHFELDDEHKPFWVVSLVRPTIQYSGEKVVKVLVVSPTTGEIQAYEPNQVPEWIDRIMPEDLAVRYVKWWGHYSQGWWPAWWSSLGLKEPTVTGTEKEIAWLIWGKDGKAHWFTGMTSTSSTDNSLISVVTVDSRTGSAKEYKVTGINETAVLSAVNASVSNFEGYHGSSPILYEISGEKVWVVPVLSSNHMFQKLAIVRASNGQVVLGDSKATAVRELKNLLARDGNQGVPGEHAALKTLKFKILRVSSDVVNGNSVYHVTGEGINHVLLLQSTLSPLVPLLQAGDLVEVQVLESTDEAISVQTFRFLE